MSFTERLVASFILFLTIFASMELVIYADEIETNDTSKYAPTELTQTMETIPYEEESELPIVWVEEPVSTNELKQYYEMLARVTCAECETESYECKVAVACAILNGADANGIDYHEQLEEWQYADPINKLEDISHETWVAVWDAVENRPYKDATLYYSVLGGFYSQWHEEQTYLYTIGVVKFFKLKG